MTPETVQCDFCGRDIDLKNEDSTRLSIKYITRDSEHHGAFIGAGIKWACFDCWMDAVIALSSIGIDLED